MSLLELPDEIILAVITSIDIDSLFNLRKVCVRLHKLTKDLSLWKNILECLRPAYPTESYRPVHELSVKEFERLAVRTIRINDYWLRKRTLPTRTIPKSHTDGTLFCKIFFGRWILNVSTEGKVQCQDLLLRTNTVLQLREKSWNSCTCRLYEGNRIRLAITAIGRIQRWTPVTAIVEVWLEATISSTIEHIGGFVTQYPANTQTFGTGLTEELVAFTRGCLVDIVNWKTKAHASIPTHAGEPDELWNEIIGLRFCGRFMLCIKARSVEIYDIPLVEDYGLFPPNDSITAPGLVHPLEMHRFVHNNFRQAETSDYTETSDVGTIRVLLSDTLQGLYLFDIHIRPIFRINLLGKRTLGPRDGFVSAFALGPEGKRGVWVERRRSDTQRSVIAFNVPVAQVDSHGDKDTTLESAIVYDFRSYDLREDFIGCSFSAAAGCIVLVKRCGDLVVLDCWKSMDQAELRSNDTN